MKILFVGEIVAKPGREVVSKFLPEIIKENKDQFNSHHLYAKK